MARTTPVLVAGIIEVDPALDLTPFITTATELVSEVCGGAGYTSERLELIERWLAAHFYSVRDPRAIRERAGTVEAEYQSKVGLNLQSSHYGQTALSLDTEGGLAALSLLKPKMTVSATWLGNEEDRGDI